MINTKDEDKRDDDDDDPVYSLNGEVESDSDDHDEDDDKLNEVKLIEKLEVKCGKMSDSYKNDLNNFKLLTRVLDLIITITELCKNQSPPLEEKITFWNGVNNEQLKLANTAT